MELLRYLEGWVRDYQGPPEVVVGLFRGSESGECATSWLTAEGSGGFGSLTLWESGDLAVEIYEAESGNDVLRYRGRARTTADLGPHLAALVRSCAGSQPREATVCMWPVLRQDRTGNSLAAPRLRL